MNLIERIQKGKDLILRGRSYGKDTTALEIEVENLQCSLKAEVSQLKLSEFTKRNMALLVDSRVLGEYVWFCSNIEIATQVRRDDPEKVCYTSEELQHLLNLNPSCESLKVIHEAKTLFVGSILKETVEKKNELNKLRL